MAITTADIHEAADRIAAAGQQPTLAAVRTALGGGSFTTISEAMRAWKATRQAAALPIREAAPIAVTERLGELAAELWAVAIGMSNDRLASEREALEVTRQEMEQAQREAAELADQMGIELEQQAAALKQAEAQVALLQSAQIAQRAAEAALTEAQKRADGLVVMLEKAQAKAEKAIEEAARLAGKLEALSKK